MDVVDFEIKGSEMQFVEIELDPGEAAVGEAGSTVARCSSSTSMALRVGSRCCTTT